MSHQPIREHMDTTRLAPARVRASDLHLLRDCLALGALPSPRVPARVRLEEALGPDLARRLVVSLSQSARR